MLLFRYDDEIAGHSCRYRRVAVVGIRLGVGTAGSVVHEQVARLAVERFADGRESREAHRARLPGLENREVGERDPDPLVQFGQRETARVEQIVELDLDWHDQIVPSSLSRMAAPCSNTIASTNSRRTASQR